MKSAISFVDLFSGAGGWTLGLSMAGMKHLASIDNDPDACGTAEDVSGGRIYCADATRPPKELLCLRPKVVVGSPPCQGFSTQGVKVESDPRNTLVWTFLDLVEHFNPEVWLFENVPGFASMYGGRFVDAVRLRLNAMSNYETQEMLLSAVDAICLPCLG